MYSLPQKNLVKCQNPCHNLMHEIEIQVVNLNLTSGEYWGKGVFVFEREC